MEKAVIRTIVRTTFANGNYRNNAVELEIPAEAAEIIKKAWTSEGPLAQRHAIKAKWLAENQTADATLVIDGKVEAGFTYMTSVEKVKGEHFLHEVEED